MKDNFYRAFEERYYASREVIKSLRTQYLPFVKPLVSLYPGSATFDAGCGRGEWLELMCELGFSPFGVDLDDGMLESCVELGLPAQKGDAVTFLASLPNSSQVIISAFHVVEHITFNQLRSLVSEALRVLKPGGLLIMETPNPENLLVATRNFYLDPTHQRPIPSQLLAFVAEYTGFARVKTLRLQESKELINRDDIRFQDVFAGASPDYAIIAQKHAPDEIMELTKDQFSAEYGLSLEELLNRWDGRFNQLVVNSERSAAQAAQANERANVAEAQAAQANERANVAEAQAQVIGQQHHAVINSRSWKVTKPLRLAGKFARWFYCGTKAWLTFAPGSRPHRAVKKILIRMMNTVNGNPALKRKAITWLNKSPKLKQHLKNIASSQRLGEPYPSSSQSMHVHMPDTPQLSPRTRQIYTSLKNAIEKSDKELK
ncbi:class I SAM-dependent methyltransferase [Acidithiobacillus sp. VAN18-1]|uniref:Class I SAM-dependent methyltransferase n=1 Tax=Igneacidithiobacillus copahuensis TaxID=2724909 RepID=A0AAE2YMT6_9PROT|nr:class I SAM-dependent methyltransferase [Igneacidithiobacillus copahuensis]MBU2787015.1 class I SAM-dependent methyltransferase [Igneacidithiobacillus copahuensis]MBU2796846.1 class I SAM-dependent methyltransferase [Acidithiobacillus sp. VAN18-2]